jgi:hypothetical protein
LHKLHAKQSTPPERGAHEHPIGHRFLKQIASLFAIAIEAAKQVVAQDFITPETEEFADETVDSEQAEQSEE